MAAAFLATAVLPSGAALRVATLFFAAAGAFFAFAADAFFAAADFFAAGDFFAADAFFARPAAFRPRAGRGPAARRSASNSAARSAVIPSTVSPLRKEALVVPSVT